jgi:serine protease AprX
MKPARSKCQIVFILTLIAILLSGLAGPPVIPAAAQMQSVIITGKNVDQIVQVILEHGGEISSRLDIIHGVAADVPANAVAALQSEPAIAQIHQNTGTSLSDYHFAGPAGANGTGNPATDYPNLIGADQVWEQGYTGQGIGVAILDTGIAIHPGLDRSVDGSKRSLSGWVDFIDGKKKPFDPNGHGTHIAGIIANAALGSDDEWNGVAPGVNLVGVRVLDETGAGTYESVINGIQWVLEHKDEYNIKVLNLSLHSLVQSPYWSDPLNQAVMRAWAEGITVVVAAGNGGPGPMTITVPGNVPYVITVGAFTDHYTPSDWSDDYITPFSAAGPTLDNFVKPDLVAPGGHIVSTMMPSSYLARSHEANRITSQYFSMAGTSQAAAITSGVTALVLSRNPGLSPNQVKYRVMATALAWVTEDETEALYSIWQQGMGRLNAADAVLTDLDGFANQGMDVWGDLNGNEHYQGYTYFDSETGAFKLLGNFYEPSSSAIGSWSGSIGSWSGAIGSWSGSNYAAWGDAIGSWSGAIGSWSGAIGSWSGAIGSWSGAIGSWSGAIGSWSGAIGSWSGAIGSWSGGYTSWVGGMESWIEAIGSWSGGVGSWSGSIVNTAYIEAFSSGKNNSSPDNNTSLSGWINEPKP